MTTTRAKRRSSIERTETALIVLALLLPTLGAWAYFVQLAGRSGALAVYFGFKILQFSLPLAAIWLCPVTGPQYRDRRASTTLRHGLGSGAVMASATLVGYFALLRGGGLAAAAAIRIAPKLDDFKIGGVVSFVVMALLLSFLHSFLEEYYFRGFIFNRLRSRLNDGAAIGVSSLGFAAHHVIVIATYVGWSYWGVTILFSVGLAITGAYWSVLYRRTNSLVAPWVSHVCADLAVMAVGYDLLWGAG